MTHDNAHILIAEDSQLNRTMLAQNLGQQGYTVTLVENGRQALGMIRAGSFDLMLLDILMPEIDGYQVLEHLKRNRISCDIPVIVISVIDDMDSIVKCIEMGAEDYLTKPFDPVLLKVKIGACLEKKRLRDQEQAHLKQLQQRNYALSTLNRLGQQFAAMLDTRQITEQLPRAITEVIGAQGASLWLWDEEREGHLVCRAAFSTDIEHPSLLNLRLEPGQGVAGWVAQQGKSIVISNTSDDSRFFPGIDEQTGFRTTSLLAVPLQLHFAVVGVVEVVNKLDGNFDSDDLSFIETLAASAAIAIDNAALFEAHRQLSDELKIRNEELDAFAHTVAHDLKGTLNNIVGFASMLKDNYHRMSDEQLHTSLEMVAQSGHKMASIVDELLLLTTVRKMETVDMKPLDMADIVAQAQERLIFMIEERQAEIILPNSWPVAVGHSPWVEEVWVNYISNALKYGGQPSEGLPPRVEVGATPLEDGLVRFWVRDNGPGLTSEEQARVFTPFERLHQVRIEGQGLGLSIVQRIVEKLGGQVGIESQVGQGSIFSFTLSGKELSKSIDIAQSDWRRRSRKS